MLFFLVNDVVCRFLLIGVNRIVCCGWVELFYEGIYSVVFVGKIDIIV